MENNQLELSPLYDNSSSLCAYISESKIDSFLGKDKLLWKSLVDSKSKSLIRIKKEDKSQPTHVEMLQTLSEKYYQQTYPLVDKILTLVTADAICGILNKYKGKNFSEKRKELIEKFIISKIQMIETIYKERKN